MPNLAIPEFRAQKLGLVPGCRDPQMGRASVNHTAARTVRADVQPLPRLLKFGAVGFQNFKV